jgi:hypothetical protein
MVSFVARQMTGFRYVLLRGSVWRVKNVKSSVCATSYGRRRIRAEVE